MTKLVTGTVQQLIEAGVKVNNREVTPTELALILNLGLGRYSRKVGPIPKSVRGDARGKPHMIWEIQSNDLITVDAPASFVSSGVKASAPENDTVEA